MFVFIVHFILIYNIKISPIQAPSTIVSSFDLHSFLPDRATLTQHREEDGDDDDDGSEHSSSSPE